MKFALGLVAFFFIQLAGPVLSAPTQGEDGVSATNAHNSATGGMKKLLNLLHSLGMNWEENDLEDLVKSLDVNGDGCIKIDEVKNILKENLEDIPEKYLQLIINKYDVIVEALDSLGLELDESSIENMIKKVDLNGDKTVTPQELKKSLMSCIDELTEKNIINKMKKLGYNVNPDYLECIKPEDLRTFILDQVNNLSEDHHELIVETIREIGELVDEDDDDVDGDDEEEDDDDGWMDHHLHDNHDHHHENHDHDDHHH